MSRDSPPNATEPLPRSSRPQPFVPDANIRNFAPVARIMKTALPDNAKIAKEAKECMQECVSEFISFITSEGVLTLNLASWTPDTAHFCHAKTRIIVQRQRNVNKKRGRL